MEEEELRDLIQVLHCRNKIIRIIIMEKKETLVIKKEEIVEQLKIMYS